MGLIRKTLSVGTLGTVSFRSKKERLRRAEASLEREHAARSAAEARIGDAESRVKRASAEAASASRRLERSKRRRRRNAETVGDVISGLEPMIRTARADVTERGRRAGRRGRKAAKRSLRGGQVIEP